MRVRRAGLVVMKQGKTGCSFFLRHSLIRYYESVKYRTKIRAFYSIEP